jgi:hypothetical protein
VADEQRIVVAETVDEEARRILREYWLLRSIARKQATMIERLELALIQHCPQGLH